ncbi:MAG: phosphoribosyl-ATP diphosphatase [Candidatus Margulisbacteria bacterium]|nr:phosphoribosyl-ATP diphosphatase [Candidatus Margulisiibacteriota bacterium]
MTFLTSLDQLIQNRKQNMPDGSYTATLFNEGLDRILRKVAEESGEVIIAAKNEGSEELKQEVADLMFHLLVLCHEKGVSLADIEDVLESRHQKS